MKLLLDTDAFCKLSLCGVLHDAAHLLGADLPECGRLPALPYMLRRGRLRKIYGPEISDTLMKVATELPLVPQPNEIWLDKLTPVQAIDPGEAQIFAAAAERGLLVVSGDKRALRALREVEGYAAALAGRIVVLEAILLALSNHLGSEEVRQRVQPLLERDKVIRMSFSIGSPDPQEALLSYYRGLAADLDPLQLWAPFPGARA